MKKHIYFSSILTFLIILISCRKEEERTSIVPIIPINTGNSWTYVDTTIAWNSSVFTRTVNIGDYVNINGNKGYLLDRIDNPTLNKYNVSILVNNNADGDYVIVGGYSDKDSLFINSIATKRKPREGESWTFSDLSSYWSTGIFGITRYTKTCLNVDTVINIPLGTFKCVSQIYNNGNVNVVYLSEGIGMIKSEQYLNENDFFDKKIFCISTLTNYKINK